MINIKILVTDFDNTLYRNDKELKKNIKLINKFKQNNLFIIATGRAFYEIEKPIKQYNIKYDYLVCNDGGMVLDSENRILNDVNMDVESATKIIEYLENNKIEGYFVDTGHERVKNIKEEVNAIIIKNNDLVESQKILNDILLLSNRIYGYISNHWINITNKEVSKGNGLNYLCKKFNLNKKDIYVIGDAINDIPMIKEFDGYAVNNCDEEVKKYAKRLFNGIEEFIKFIEKE